MDNQEKLADNIKNQNSISIEIINKFNSTVQQISQNEKILQSKIHQIAELTQNKENEIFAQSLFTQIIDLYEIINSVLQDIENSIAFSKLNTMHPSIMKTEDLLHELIRLERMISSDQLPFELTLENTILLERLINVESYISGNRITYLLKLPIMSPQIFDYYHLYAIPIYNQNYFKVVIPIEKFLLKNELYYTYQSRACFKILPNYFICKKSDLSKIQETSPCEVQMLSMKNPTSCKTVKTQISETSFRQLENSTQWIAVFPNQEKLSMKCQDQEEVADLRGTFIINIPFGCSVTTPQTTILNQQQTTREKQIVNLPNFNNLQGPISQEPWAFKLQDLKLDELQNIRKMVTENEPRLSFDNKIHHLPSIWTIIIYCSIILVVSYALFRRCYPRTSNPSSSQHQTGSSQEGGHAESIQLPRLAA